ncbi:sugar ABC transporter permease [soil metagenome]
MAAIERESSQLGAPALAPRAGEAPWWERNLSWLLISPTLLLLILFALGPSIFVIRYAVSHVRLIRGSTEFDFIGYDNFQRAWNDNLVRESAVITLKWMIGVTLSEVVLGLLLAVLITQDIRFRPVVTTLLIIPIIMPPVSVAIAWYFMYNGNFGIFNYLLGKAGVAPVQWLSDVDIALYAMMVVDIWQATPFVFLLLFAAIVSLPRDPYEAAAIDGAGALRVFRTITLPLMTPVLLIVILLRLIDSARAFDKIYIMTKGGPGTSAYTMTLTTYVQAFVRLDWGYASALSFMFQIALIIMGTIYVKRMMTEYTAPTG